MTLGLKAFVGADIFDGVARHSDHALLVDGTQIVDVVPATNLASGTDLVTLDGGLLCPGFVDLQVNGGGGLLFNDDQSVSALSTMAKAHAHLGATSILPTLITDTPQRVTAAIDAVEAAVCDQVPGILGLHLEGPHLSLPRKGAHDPSLIRPMNDQDLALYLDAAQRLPVLKITVAPETVAPDQIRLLAQAGIVVSLGHSDATFETCLAAVEAGARCVTHLFNAMSQLTNREPGIVGAALSNRKLCAGLIADGIHVHRETLGAAMRAKRGLGEAEGALFLVSDAMALAGSEKTSFLLNGRRVERQSGRLTLEDGTLAGADLDLLTAVQNIVSWGHASLEEAWSMATVRPAKLVGLGGRVGALTAGAQADFLHVAMQAADKPSHLAGVWQAGQKIGPT